MAGYVARSCTARSGSHFTLTSSAAERRSLMANILPATLNTDVWSLNGNSSVTPGRARHQSRRASAVIGAGVVLGENARADVVDHRALQPAERLDLNHLSGSY